MKALNRSKVLQGALEEIKAFEELRQKFRELNNEEPAEEWLGLESQFDEDRHVGY